MFRIIIYKHREQFLTIVNGSLQEPCATQGDFLRHYASLISVKHVEKLASR
jgi:hypothetical protein